MDKKLITFSGGRGGGGAKEPVRTPDNLVSQDYFELVLAISEGPIKGVVSQNVPPTYENLYADSTALYNIGTGQANFSDLAITEFCGQETDPPLALKLGGVSASFPVNVTLAYNIPVTRQTVSVQRGLFSAIEVRINFSRLYREESDGIFDAEALFRIEYKPVASPLWLQAPFGRVYGKTTSGYARDYVIEIPPLANDDYEIRLTKLSPEGPGVTTTATIVWESFQLINRKQLQHPGLAFRHVYGKASDEFSSVPQFSSVEDGLLVKVPTNYNTETRSYDETVPWDGTFKIDYTNNGVWVLYDLLTNENHGLARYYKGVTVNRFEFYEEAKWVDTPVPDGRGGMQPMFTFNEEIRNPTPGKELLRYVAGSFNAVLTDDGNGVIGISTDRPKQATQVFTPESVENGEFVYSFVDIPVRYNDVVAVFVNPDLGWEEDRRQASIDNSQEVARYGRISDEFVAVGCTDAAEATRRANLRYLASTKEITTVTFTTNRYGLLCRLLDTILIADPLSGWSSGGRVKEVASGVIFLRSPLYVEDLSQRQIQIQTPLGISVLSIVPANIGECYQLQITSGAYPANAPDKALFTVQDMTGIGMPKPFRVLSIEEVEGSPDVVRITALEVYENKYQDAATGILSPPVQYSFITPGAPSLPLSIAAFVPPPIVNPDGSLVYSVEVEWSRASSINVARYEIDYKTAAEGSWKTVSTQSDRVTITPVQVGAVYAVRLYAVSPTGGRSQRYISTNILVEYLSGPFENVAGFTANKMLGGVFWRWTPSGSPGYRETEVREADENWGDPDTPPVFKGRADYYFESVHVPGIYTRYARHISSAGSYSQDAATYSVTVTTDDIPSPGSTGFGYIPESWAPGMIGGVSNLRFLLNRTDPGTEDLGELYASGNLFEHPNGSLVSSGLTGKIMTPYGDGVTGECYVVYSAAPVASRFPGLGWTPGHAENLFLARLNSTAEWEAVHDNPAAPGVVFTPLASDCIIAAVTALSNTSGISAIYLYISSSTAVARSLSLIPSTQVVKVAPNGTPSHTSVTFTAVGQGLAGAPSFSVVQGDASLTVAGLVATLAYASFVSELAVIRVDWAGLSDFVTVAKIRDGSDAIVAFLTNQSALVPTAPDGSGGDFSTAGGAVKVYRGGADISTGNGVQYTIAPGATVAMTLHPSTGLYQVQGLVGLKGAARIIATVGTTEYPLDYDISKVPSGQPGQAGNTVIPVLIYQRSAAGAPALPTNNVVVTLATGGFVTGPNNGWTATFAEGPGVLYVAAATAAGTGVTDTIAPNEWAAPRALVGNGAPGISAASVTLYKRTTTSDLPSGPNGPLVYTFATASLSGPGFNGWSEGIPSATAGKFLYVVRATALSVGGAAEDEILPGEWSASVLFARDGDVGSPGPAGQQYATAYLYKFAPTVGGAPTGSSSFVWATGQNTSYSGGNSWQVTVPENPGTSGVRLWVASKPVSAAAGTVSTPVDWSTGVSISAWAANGLPGPAGASGIQSATPTVFRWDNSIPTISGVSTYQWSTSTISSIPSGWSVNPGAGSPGQTLYGASVELVDTAGVFSSTINWTQASIFPRGYNGSSSPGSSARNAYVVTTLTSLGSGTVQTDGPNSLPPSNSVFGSGLSWLANAPGSLSPGQNLYKSDGLYNSSTDKTIWGTPYLASFKVGLLSAVAVNTGSLNVSGTLTVAEDGAIRFGPNGYLGGTIWMGYQSSTYRISFGNTSRGLAYDGDRVRLYGVHISAAEFVIDDTGANFFGLLRVGSALISGLTMAGSGAVLNRDGSFALGNNQYNITFNGVNPPRLNGDWVATGNLQSGSVTTPKIGDQQVTQDKLANSSLSVSLAPSSIVSFSSTSGVASHGTCTASASGGRAPYTFQWVLASQFASPSSASGSIYSPGVSGPGGSTLLVNSVNQADGSQLSAYFSVTVTDATGRSVSSYLTVTVQRGVQP